MRWVGVSLVPILLLAVQVVAAHDNPLPGNGPGTGQGAESNNRPSVHPGRQILHTGKGSLQSGNPAATGGPFDAHNIAFLSQLTLADMGAGNGVRGNDIWGWTDPLDKREYALVGRSDGTAFVDVTDPANPLYLGFLPTHTGNRAWRDIKVYANHAYVVSDDNGDHGMQVFDLTQLRSVDMPPVIFAETAHYSGFGKGHNIVINEATGFGYAVGANSFSGGLHFIDLNNPAAPVAAGGFSADGYTHDAQVVSYSGPDSAYSGREIAFCSNEDTLTIVDVTDKGLPVQLSRTSYANAEYTHQGWLTEDHAYFLSNDELDEYRDSAIDFTRTHIWDVADIDAPLYLGFYEAAVQSIDHNLYIHNGLVYAANYTAGLRVLEHGNIASASLSEVAYIDTHPSKDSVRSFDGAWSVYPFFASGTVVIGDRDEGLVIVRLLQADVSVSATDAPDPVTQGSQITYSIDVVNNGLDVASNVTLTDDLPAGVTHELATPSQGSCSETGGTVTCLLGDLANGDSVSVVIMVTADSPLILSNTVSAGADEIDRNRSNNAVTLVTTILPDTDGDGLDDDFEVSIGTSPVNPDTDGDGLDDGVEVNQYATDPLDTDTDTDGFSDGEEVLAGSLPLDPGSIPGGASGDVNGDTVVDIVDVMLAYRIARGELPADTNRVLRGDVAPLVAGVPAPDGQLDIADILIIQRKMMGLVSGF